MADYVDALMEQTSVNNAWNAAQAEMNRDWQEYMSGSSHQREVADLIAAGLNPVLSANSGSTWQAVSNATADTSSAQAFGNLAATYMNNQASIEMSKIAAGAQVAAASSAASIAARATEYAAQKSYDAQVDSVPSTVHVGFGPFDFTTSGPNGKVQDLVNSAAQIYADKYYG